MSALNKQTIASSLPANFSVKSFVRIKRKCGHPRGFQRLPFVAGRRAKTATPAWAIPATGGYFGGYHTGEAMALAFMKYQRGGPEFQPGLTEVVRSFMRRFEEEGGKTVDEKFPDDQNNSFESFRGQYVGFFNTISSWLSVLVKTSGNGLDSIEDKDLISMANKGLSFDCKAYMASLSGKDKS